MSNGEQREIKPHQSKKALDAFFGWTIRVSERFLRKLYDDDAFYQSAVRSFVAPEDAKKLFLYGSVRAAKKATIATKRQMEVLDADEDNRADSSLKREILESVIDEQFMWTRKLTEHLVNLILFQQTDKGEYYRVYISAENLDLFKGKLDDCQAFLFEDPTKNSGNLRHSVNGYRKRIEDDLAALSVESSWFLEGKNYKDERSPIFRSVANKYKEALKTATDEERLILGSTYHDAFSLPSFSLHANVSAPPRQVGVELVRVNIQHTILLSQHIVSRANALMGFDENEDIKKIQGTDSNEPELLATMKKKFEVGDLVLAYDNLGEVIDKAKTQFGYTSYLVKFLVRPPIPETPEDWISSQYMALLSPKSKIREFFNNNFSGKRDGEELKEVLSQTDDQLYTLSRELLIDLEKRGALKMIFFPRRHKKQQ